MEVPIFMSVGTYPQFRFWKVVATILLFRKREYDFTISVGRENDFAFYKQKMRRCKDIEPGHRLLGLTTIVFLADGQSLGIEVVRLPLGNSKVSSNFLV